MFNLEEIPKLFQQHKNAPLGREILKFLCRGKTNADVAQILGIGIRTVARYKDKHKLNYFEYEYPHLYGKNFTDSQNNFFIGSMLGDGCIGVTAKETYNNKFRLKQCEAYKEYLDWALDNFPWFINQYKDENHAPKNTETGIEAGDETTRLLIAYVDETVACELFTEQRKKWYLEGTKIVPKDLVLNWELISHWFVQDGSNNHKKGYLSISTNGFTFTEAEFLRGKLYTDVGVEASIWTKKYKNGNVVPVLAIGRKHYYDFIEKVKPYIPYQCFQYKLDTTQVNRQTTEYIPKMGMEIAKEIRQLYFEEEMTQQEIADLYDISQNCVKDVVNGKTYKEGGVNVSGNFEVIQA